MYGCSILRNSQSCEINGNKQPCNDVNAWLSILIMTASLHHDHDFASINATFSQWVQII